MTVPISRHLNHSTNHPLQFQSLASINRKLRKIIERKWTKCILPTFSHLTPKYRCSSSTYYVSNPNVRLIEPFSREHFHQSGNSKPFYNYLPERPFVLIPDSNSCHSHVSKWFTYHAYPPEVERASGFAYYKVSYEVLAPQSVVIKH